jgi:broad specificity phosphatase PhoE
MKRYLRTLRSIVDTLWSWIFILGIYFSTTWRFLRWRIQLWIHPTLILVESTSTRMKRTLFFVRHGQTTWNVEQRLPGQLPGVPLNETGRQQAARLGESLSAIPISAIITSPLERAYDTAAYLAKGRNLEIQLEPDLMDTNVGPWAGKLIKDVSRDDPAWKAYVKDPTVAPEGVETFPQLQNRVVAAVERWLTRDDIGAYPVFVGHGDVVKLLMAYYTGLSAARAGSLNVDNASASIVELNGDAVPNIVALSWSPKPGWLKPPVLEKEKADAQPNANQPQAAELAGQTTGEQKT